jgi:hypothetical protein
MTTVSIADLAASPDIDKLVTLEWELARRIEQEDWTPSDPDAYWIPFTDGEVHKVEIDGIALAEKPSFASCAVTASSFYYDVTFKNLFIHTPDSDAPDTIVGSDYKYCIVAYFFVGFANTLLPIQRADQLLVDGKMDWWTAIDILEFWTKIIVGNATLARSTAVYNDLSAYCARLDVNAGGSSVLIYQDVICKMGGKTRLRFNYKTSAGAIPKLRFYNTGGNVYLKEDGTWNAGLYTISLSSSVTWTTYELTFNANAGYNNFRLAFLIDAPGSIYIDNAELWRYREEMDFLPYLGADSLPAISQSIGSYHQQEEQLSFGTIKFNDDGWFAARYADTSYLWNNKNIYVKLGFKDSDYEDLAFLFWGQTRRPNLERGIFSIDIKDQRIEFKSVPVSIFDPAVYDTCEENWINKPIPILLGTVLNMAPPQCDTTGYTFKISEVVFGSKTYPIQAIDAVRKDDAALGLGVDYNYNLGAGIFTLFADPGQSIITCDAKGLVMDFDTFVYNNSYVPGTMLKFLLRDLNNIPVDRINLASLYNLRLKRNLSCGLWIKDATDSANILTLLKNTGAFHFFMLPNGEYFARILEDTVPADAPHFYTHDIKRFSSYQNIDQCYQNIIIKYKKSEIDGVFQEYKAVSDRADWEHGAKKTFEFETCLNTTFQSEDLGDNYRAMLKHPFNVVSISIGAEGLLLNPTDKFYLTYVETGADGVEVTIFSDKVFIITDITKNVNDLTAEIIAVENVPRLFWTIT